MATADIALQTHALPYKQATKIEKFTVNIMNDYGHWLIKQLSRKDMGAQLKLMPGALCF